MLFKFQHMKLSDQWRAARHSSRGFHTRFMRQRITIFHTYSTEDDINVAISDAANNATRVDAVYVISTGVTASTGTPTGGTGTGWTSRSTPTEVTSYGGATISTEVNGLVHDFLFAADRIYRHIGTTSILGYPHRKYIRFCSWNSSWSLMST